ncbi:MAG: FAD-binding protein, partial [Myxococcales bacterium]|nr:FAD-binding protein [Myxococcales bacterium]
MRDHQPLRGDQAGVQLAGRHHRWDEHTDVVVVGLGAAGGAAAIEARTGGADVLLVDRFAGGGATGKSAGAIYFGGGTDLQRQAGYDDSPE